MKTTNHFAPVHQASSVGFTNDGVEAWHFRTTREVAMYALDGVNETIAERLMYINGVRGTAIERFVHHRLSQGSMQLIENILGGSSHHPIRIVSDVDRRACTVRALGQETKRADLVGFINGRPAEIYFDKIAMNNVVQNRWNYASDLSHTVGVICDAHPGIHVTLCNILPMENPYFEKGASGAIQRMERPKDLAEYDVAYLMKVAQLFGGHLSLHQMRYAFNPAFRAARNREDYRDIAKRLYERGERMIHQEESLIAPLETMVQGMVSRLLAVAGVDLEARVAA